MLSIAAVIRELVEDSLRRDAANQRATAAAVIGVHASGLRDVAAEHDAHLADAHRA